MTRRQLARKYKRNERMVAFLRWLWPAACGWGRKRMRRFESMSMQKAWGSASAADLRAVLKRAQIEPPARYRCNRCGMSSLCMVSMPDDADAIRKAYKGRIPAKLTALYKEHGKKKVDRDRR